MSAQQLVALYRETLRRARYLGGDRGRSVRLEAQGFFAQARALPAGDAARAQEHLAQAESRLSFLRMLTPRYAGAAADAASTGGGAAGGTFVIRDGKVVASAALREGKARHSQYDGGNLDPDSVARHRQLLERQHFGGPTWRGRQPRSPFARG